MARGSDGPTNHGGHTHEPARRHEADARIAAMRAAHNSHHHAAPGGAHAGNHRSLFGGGKEHGASKHGEAHNVREEGGGE